MKDRKDKGRIDGPFVAWLIDTSTAPAWLAMSAHARVVYMALKARYSFKARNNGRIYLSVRQAAEETGFNKDMIARCLRELQYYGFIVMTNPGCLGVDGKGKAPHWRLTEIGHMTDPPTRDFLKWDGEFFREQRPPSYYRHSKFSGRKKQNPVLPSRTPRLTVQDIPVSDTVRQSSPELSDTVRHTAEPACLTVPDISRVTISVSERSGVQGGEDPPVIPDDLSIPDFMRR
jgi:hypothetical protein